MRYDELASWSPPPVLDHSAADIYSESVPESLSRGELGVDIDAVALSDVDVEGDDDGREVMIDGVVGTSVGMKSFCFMPVEEEGQKSVTLVAVEEEL